MGSNSIHIFIWFYGVEWVIFCSVGAEPRLSANFGQFGADIMLNFFDSRLQIIVFKIAQLMGSFTINRLYLFLLVLKVYFSET